MMAHPKISLAKPCAFTAVMIIMLLAGCSPIPAGSAMDASPLLPSSPVPTSSIPTSATQITPEGPGPEPSIPAPAELKPYAQPDALFELNYPGDWTIETDGATIRIDDETVGASVWISMLQMSCASTEDSFLRMVSARETNLFSPHQDYLETERVEDIQGDSVLVTKHLTSGEDAKVVSTFYRENGSLVLIFELWSPEASYKETRLAFDGIVKSLILPAPEQMDPEISISTSYITYENSDFAVDVPVTWQRTESSRSSSEVTTFTAPDLHTVYQVAVYTDNRPIPKSTAGDFVLVLLREMYARDIVITSDLILEDGSEQLQWKSSQGGYQGITTFAAFENKVALRTGLYDAGYQDCSLNELERISSTYMAK